MIATPDVDELESRARIRHLMARGRFADATHAMDTSGLEGDELALYRVWIRTEEALADGDDELDPGLAKLAADALKENRQLGFAYYVLGRLAEAERRHEDAARAFRIASQLSPEHRDARRREKLSRRRG